MSSSTTQDNASTTTIDLDFALKVTYQRDNPFETMHNEKYYPVTINDVKLRGQSIYNLLHISHIMTLQRRIYHRILDEEEKDGP